MVIPRFRLAYAAALGLVVLLPRCAPVHDATPASCPTGQEPSGAMCVCVSTQAVPVDGQCPPEENLCSVDDCVDDDNPCTEPACPSQMGACINETVANLTPCDDGDGAGACWAGVCFVPEPQWELGVPFIIGGGSGEIIWSDVAVDANGRAFAVWSELDALMACRFDPSEGWEGPIVVEKKFAPDRTFAIDMDADGNAIVVYARVEQGSIDIRAVRYDATRRTWLAPDVVSRDGAIAGQPSVAITSGGDAVATWWEAPDAVLLSRLPAAGSTWDAPVVISPNDGFDKADPYLSMADTGQGALIYRGDGPGGLSDTVWVTPIGPNDFAGAPVEVDASAEEVVSVRVAAAENGELMAVWEQGNDMWWARFSQGQWKPPGLLETSSEDPYSQQVASDGTGSFFAVWGQGGEIRARRFDANEQAWGDLVIFKTDGGAYRPSLVAGSGEAWLVLLDEVLIRYRHYAMASGWGTMEDLSLELQSDSPPAHEPHLDRGSDGTLVAVWPDGADLWAWVDKRQ